MSKNLIIPLLTGTLLGVSFFTSAQTQKSQKLGANGRIGLVTFEQDKAAKLTVPATEVFKKILKLNADASYKPLAKQAAANGLEDEKYQLYYKDLPVEFSVYSAHFKNGSLTSVNGDYYEVDGLSTKPSVPEKTALAAAVKSVDSQNFVWQMKEYLGTRYSEPKGELVVLPFTNDDADKKAHLAYKFDIYSVAPFYRANVYVDAHTGKVIFTNQISRGQQISQKQKEILQGMQKMGMFPNPSSSSAPAPAQTTARDNTANADTRYSGKRYVETSVQDDGKYILLDKTRGNGIHTRSAGFVGNTITGELEPGSVSEITDNDNNWTATELGTDKTGNLHATDVQWAAGNVYDYFMQTFGRNGLDGNGMKMDHYIHFSKDLDNAGWAGTHMIYGDGNYFLPLTALDVTAHEIGHAVTQFTADLVYEKESGALNESFSDMWGALIEHQYAPEKKMWWIGEDMIKDREKYGDFLRSLEAPKSVKIGAGAFIGISPQPDTYQGQYWDKSEEVHANSGVPNHWFYILSQGKKGTNDVGISYDVTGIGLDKATQLIYRTLTTYLTPKSTFMEMRNGTLLAATDLFGEASPEYITTMNAFNAVNIGGSYDTQPPSTTDVQASSVTTHSARITWPPATDNVSIKEYRLYRNGTLLITRTAKENKLYYRDIELTANTPYSYQVVVVDQADLTTKSKLLNIKTLTLPQIDSQPPAAPVMTAEKGDDNGKPYAQLKWTVSTDDIETVGYEIYQNGQKLAFLREGDVDSYKVSDVEREKNLTYAVVAVDEDGNRTQSNEVTLFYEIPVCVGYPFLAVQAFDLIQFADVDYSVSPRIPSGWIFNGGISYTDKTDVVGHVESGKSYTAHAKRIPLSEETQYGFDPQKPFPMGAWVDWDGNGSHNPATETINFETNNKSEFTFDFTVPDNARTDKPVVIRFGSMALLGADFSDPQVHNLPCGSFLGYYIDFKLKIDKSLAVAESGAKDAVSIYPNPVHDKLFVSSAKAASAYQLFNISGQKVMEGNYKDGIDVAKLQSGVYIIRIRTGSSETSHKFIKK